MAEGVIDQAPRFAFAADDAHFVGRPDFALGWIVADAEARSHADIMEAIRSGAFYSSCGPEIHEWTLTETEMVFRCSEVETITLSAAGPRGCVFGDPEGGTLDSARVNLADLGDRENWPFLRFSCCDTKGRWAWTNPLRRF